MIHLSAQGNCFASSINVVVFRFDEDLEVFLIYIFNVYYYCASKDIVKLVADGWFC